MSKKNNGPLVNPCWSGDHADAKLAEALVLVAEATGLLDAGGFTGNAPVDLNLVGPAQDIVAALCALRVSLHDVQVVRTREQCR